MKNNQSRFFGGEIVTSLSDIFTIRMEKVLFKIIFWLKSLIGQPIFKMALFKTFGMQNGDIVIFFVSSSRKVRC